jgi:hypothetical protein
MGIFRNKRTILFITIGLLHIAIKAQTVSFAIKTSPNVSFNFTTVNQYIAGVTSSNAVRLNIEADVQWDLYVGTTTSDPGFWDEVATYSAVGDKPPVSILQMQVRNSANTSQVNGFFALRDIANPIYIIGSENPDPLINCPNLGTNAPGDYVVNSNCFRFDVDLKIIPGFNYRPGFYELRVDYILVVDL